MQFDKTCVQTTSSSLNVEPGSSNSLGSQRNGEIEQIIYSSPGCSENSSIKSPQKSPSGLSATEKCVDCCLWLFKCLTTGKLVYIPSSTYISL